MKKNDKKEKLTQKEILARRDFIQKATIVLGSAGVAPWVRRDMIEDAAAMILPKAHAAPNRTVRRFIEICFRQGVPFINIGANQQMAQLQSPKYVTNPYSSDSYIKKGSLYLAPVASPLAPHADNIAITQAFNADGIPHTPKFPIRTGGKGAGKTSPIISLAAHKKASAYSIVPGVNWYRKTVNGCCGPMKTIVNELNGKEDLVDIKEADAFANLFTPPTFRVNERERDAILEKSRKLSVIQMEKSRAVANSKQILNAHQAGMKFLKEPVGDVLDTTSMASGFNFGVDTLLGKKWHDMGYALAKTLKAFENNLMATATISVTTTDAWHGYRNSLDPNTNKSAIAAKHISSVLAAAIDYMKATPDPASATGETLFDTTVIFCTSEFTRGITSKGMDFKDQGTNGFILIGKDVKGGYYGDIDTSGSTAWAAGFDPITGAPLQKKSPLDQVHNTICWLLGLDSEMIPNVPKLEVMLRNA